MSQEQEDAVVGRMLRERVAADQHLTTLKNEAVRIGKELQDLGQMLQNDAQRLNIALECYEVFLSKETYEGLRQLKPDILKTEAELGRLNDDLRKFNV